MHSVAGDVMLGLTRVVCIIYDTLEAPHHAMVPTDTADVSLLRGRHAAPEKDGFHTKLLSGKLIVVQSV